ncbi:uncharacterized protein LOC112348881 [Selaginella moellendorffii]|uniref:uncharacterized protein LOC112348881 n=1 Tax=Selaginella moellendorffii TaxID=88036 RepID=UPI000D1D0AFC|nr:uncharacterized protein LOC112348881 [Selaginella moellendorffii]|eukprot:XP_024537986.1 uncharacterized protein LOC112348881 [Selaginella moellendorffii]
MDGIESVYGRGALGNLTNRSRRSNGTAGPSSPLSLSLDPFVWESGYENRGGGAWVSRNTPPFDEDCEGVYEMNGASPAISPRGGSPNGGVKNIMLLAKDKEALLEEAIRLKRALHEKRFYLRRNRVHATTIQIENSFTGS